MLCDVYVLKNLSFLELLRCVQLRFVALCHVTFTFWCFTLCSNIEPEAEAVELAAGLDVDEVKLLETFLESIAAYT
jgi:hypothetical protein